MTYSLSTFDRYNLAYETVIDTNKCTKRKKKESKKVTGKWEGEGRRRRRREEVEEGGKEKSKKIGWLERNVFERSEWDLFVAIQQQQQLTCCSLV